MALVVCDGGELVFLNYLLGFLNSASLRLRLYQNNHTPAPGDTAADYTEADFDGYVDLLIGNFAPVYLNGSDKAETDEINRVFTQTGVVVTNNIYGYYVTDGSGNLLWAELDPAGPIAMNAAGKTYVVYLRFTLSTE